MPWCPECKMEYVEGMTVCNDCGAQLVDSLPETKEMITFLETEKEPYAKKFVEFLHYSKIEDASYQYEEEKKKWVVQIDKKDNKQVTKLYNAFYTVETEQALSSVHQTEKTKEQESDDLMEDDTMEAMEYDMEEASSDSREAWEESSAESKEYDSMFDEEELKEIIENKKKVPEPSATYVKKEEQYKDLKSSAVTFLFVSVLGIAVLVLNAAGVIHILNGILPYFVMGALFLVFFYVGISSYQKAKKVEKEIGEENSLTDAINEWLDVHVTAEQLDELTNPNDTDEVRFFHKLEKMKEMITTEFGELNDGYLDLLVEEYYNSHFERNESDGNSDI